MGRRLPKALLPHQVIIRAAEGHGSGGAVLGPPAVKRAYVEDKTRLVRDASGQEVTSTSAVWLDLDVDAPELSEVTIRPTQPKQRTSQVVAVTTLEHPRTPSHQIVYLA